MNHEELSPDEQRELDEIIASYLRAIESGGDADKPALLRQHPHLADRLRAFFATQDRESRGLTPGIAETLAIPAGTQSDRSNSAASASCHRRFGDYELIEEIARGGMGVVHKARHVTLNRTTALKMILAGQLASEDDVLRFRSEAEAAARLDHPGIVPVYEVGQCDDQHYYSMGYVDGQSLAGRAADGPLPPVEAAGLVRAIAEAIGYAHERGIVHRDLKPGNVLLDATGQPRITDFGLAKHTERDSQLTGTGQILGTPSYMPPEQASGNSDKIGPLSDVYSVGAILYFLLTGRPPFQSANVVETLRQVMDSDPVAPRRLNPQIPLDLENICLKCLQKEPQRRYESAAELADDLGRFLAGEPTHARPVGHIERTVKWCRRRPFVAVMSAAMLLLGIAVIAGSIIAAMLINNERLAALDSEKRAKKSEVKRTEQLYVSHMAVAEQAWRDGDIRRAINLLRRHVPGAGETDLRGYEWYYLWGLCRRSRSDQQFDVENTFGGNLAFLPRSKQLVAFRDSGDVSLCDPASGQTLTFQEAIGPKGSLKKAWYSPVSAQFATVNMDGSLLIWKFTEDRFEEVARIEGDFSSVKQVDIAPGGKVFAILGAGAAVELWGVDPPSQRGESLATGGHDPASIRFSPDGRYLLLPGNQRKGGIQIWEINGTHAQLRMTVPQTGPNVQCQFTPDSKTFVSYSGQPKGELKLWSLKSGELLGEFEGHTRKIHKARFSPDGRILAATGLDRTVILWDVASQSVMTRLEGHRNWTLAVAFSPDGDQVATGGADNVVMIWDVAKGEHLETIKGHQSYISEIAYARDGELLASASNFDGKVRIRRRTEQPRPVRIRASDAAVDSVVISPDGSMAATAARDDLVKMWDLDTGQMLHEFGGYQYAGGIGVPVLAFSANGETLALADRDRVKLLDTTTGRLRREFPEVAAKCPVFSPDGLWLATSGSQNTITIRDAETGDERTQLELKSGARVFSMCFSPDGNSLAAVFVTPEEGGLLTVWETADFRKKYTAKLKGGGNPRSVAYSAYGELAVATVKGEITILRANDGGVIGEMTGHSNLVFSLAYLPQRNRLVSASVDRTIKIWDTAQLAEHFTFHGHEMAVLSAAVSKDGRTMVTAGDGGIVRLWRAPLQTDIDEFE
ncbi:MAG: protein kinase [Pirellulaceae bacterium]